MPIGMGVVMEALEEALAYVLVDERVHRDLVAPRLEFHRRRQLTVQQQVRDLEIRRVFGQLLDGIAAVRRMPSSPSR